ncbi:MAG: glycosyltransferase family 2 protein [Fimbriimonadia bacterium]|nr:glycosyltransferase family 2 protein [Fimbriimonadia bacterium]
MDAPVLALIVVSYNTRDLLETCLKSLTTEAISLQTIVVDNASSDGSAQQVREQFPEVTLIANPDNRGFGAACNQGLRAATARYALILNADIRAEPGALETLFHFMETHPDAAACGGKLLNPDGSIQPSCAGDLTLWAVFCEQTLLAKLFPNTKLFGGYWRTWWDFNQTRAVEQLMGACLLLRREGSQTDAPFPLFDEDYFLYCEDTDLCWRLRQAGGVLYYVHDAVFIHHLGASGESARANMVIYYNRGKERFFRKFHSPLHAKVCRWLNRMGALGRWSLWAALTLMTAGQQARFRQQAGLFWRVFRES